MLSYFNLLNDHLYNNIKYFLIISIIFLNGFIVNLTIIEEEYRFVNDKPSKMSTNSW